MNDCTFYGRITNGPKLSTVPVDVVRLTLCVEKKRKAKNGTNKIDASYLHFEAWDSAARTINEYAREGDYLLIKSSAKNSPEGVYFRINEFRILQNVEDFEYDD